MTISIAQPSWSSIPNKAELAIICSIRAADFFQQAALQAVMFYQLASFDSEASESQISFQVGVLQGVFTAAQIFTSVLWGKVADHPSWGRKRVILTSLVGQGISCLGVAFSRSFAVAVCWRFLGGALNASVGGARTALSEKTERKYHSRTFLLLPLAWNIAQFVGPPTGGLLSDPVKYYPRLFGKDSVFGGSTGVTWLTRFPYAAPSICCSLVMFADAFLVWVGLKETLKSRIGKRDRGLEVASFIKSLLCRNRMQEPEYLELGQDEETHGFLSHDVELSTQDNVPPHVKQEEAADTTMLESIPTPPLPFRQALTSKVLLVLSVVAFLDFGIGGFTALWSIFLSTERYNSQADPSPKLPFHFTGGLGFPPSTVGIAMSVLGLVGIVCQFTLYPRVSGRFGILRSTRYALFLFPVAHALAPYLSLLFNSLLLWIGIVVVAIINITARTFTTPGAVLLVNNSSPSPEVLGTIHGLGASVQAAARTIGPIAVGKWYSNGIERGMVGEAWWLLAGVAMLGCIPTFLLYED